VDEQMSSTPGGVGGAGGGLSPLQKGALTLGAVFVGGYAVGYVFGPLPSLEDLTGVKAVPSRTSFDGEVLPVGRVLSSSRAQGTDGCSVVFTEISGS